MSIDHTISMAIAPIGAIIAGPAVNLMGITNLYLLCAIIGIINPIFLWYFTKIRMLDHLNKIDSRVIELEKPIELEIEQKQ